jgi:hypothetical protein
MTRSPPNALKTHGEGRGMIFKKMKETTVKTKGRP